MLQIHLFDGNHYSQGWHTTSYMSSGGVTHDDLVGSTDESLFTHPGFRTRLQDLPPSAKLIAKVLDVNEPLDQAQLAEETLLPDRTIRYALNQLEEADLVTAQVNLQDARKHIYKLQRPA